MTIHLYYSLRGKTYFSLIELFFLVPSKVLPLDLCILNKGYFFAADEPFAAIDY